MIVENYVTCVQSMSIQSFLTGWIQSGQPWENHTCGSWACLVWEIQYMDTETVSCINMQRFCYCLILYSYHCTCKWFINMYQFSLCSWTCNIIQKADLCFHLLYWTKMMKYTLEQYDNIFFKIMSHLNNYLHNAAFSLWVISCSSSQEIYETWRHITTFARAHHMINLSEVNPLLSLIIKY
jgi:hypothetical protein